MTARRVTINISFRMVTYILTQIYGETKYLRCTLLMTYPWKCLGRANICESNLLNSKQEHNHASAVLDSDLIQLRNRLKRAAENSTLSLREIIDKETSDDPAGASIAYCHIRNSLVKRRKKLFRCALNPSRIYRNDLKLKCSEFV